MAQDNYPMPGVAVWQNPNRMGGVLCFAPTRVPFVTLFEHLEGGIPLHEFLDAFEGVNASAGIAVLQYAKSELLQAAA